MVKITLFVIISFQKGKEVGDQALPGSKVLQVIDASFNQEVIQSSIPVLVDFWAPWCGPCRMITSVIDEIADECKENLKVVKINTDENPSTATEYGIRSIPTIMIFIEGKKVDTVIGAVPKSTLASALQKHLQKK